MNFQQDANGKVIKRMPLEPNLEKRPGVKPTLVSGETSIHETLRRWACGLGWGIVSIEKANDEDDFELASSA